MKIKYEWFEDLSYYSKYAVRKVGATEWGDCWHVDSKEEAEGLCAVLNSYESKLAIARGLVAGLEAGCKNTATQRARVNIEAPDGWQGTASTKLVEMLFNKGMTCAEVVLESPSGSTARADKWGKVTWTDNKQKAGAE